MKRLGLFLVVAVLGGVLLGASEPPPNGAPAHAREDALSTERRVNGVITSVGPETVTIASSQRTVTGKIDPSRTKVRVNGKPGAAADLKLTARAKGELCLDDVWLVIEAH